MSDGSYRPNDLKEVLEQPILIEVGKSFIDTRIMVNGRNLPCTFLQITVDVPDHTRYRISPNNALPKVEIEVMGGRNELEKQNLVGRLISEEDFEEFARWRSQEQIKGIRERRNKEGKKS